MSLSLTGVAHADNIQDSIEATDTPVALVAGSSTEGTATVRVVGNNNDTGTGTGGTSTDPNCNWDTGESPLVLSVVTPSGVTATPDSLSITTCNVDHRVTFTASATAVSGTATVTVVSTPAGGGGYNNQVSIPITVTQPASTNTKPAVTVTGVTDGASYQIGSVPTAGCSVTDTQDGPSTHAAALTGTLSHGLGTQTATCDHTDEGGLKADTRTATYSIIDTGKPTISHTLSPASPNGSNGWYTSPVTVDFTCSDGGAGIQSCTGDTTLGDGANQSASGTATDWAGNTATDSVTGINVDSVAPNAPTASLSPSPNGDGWNRNTVIVHFTGNGDNGASAASGLASCTSDVTVDTETANRTVTGTCTDLAGNTSTPTEVTVKLDKHGPVISNDVTVEGTQGNGDWYRSAVEVTFTATDTLSGPATQTKKVTSNGQGTTVEVTSPAFTDTAGNTTDAGAVTKSYQIDTEAPSVGEPELSGTLGNNGWYRSAVTASFTATDNVSGIAGDRTRTVTSTQQGTGIVLESPEFSDIAGNTTPARNKSATVNVDSVAPSVSLLYGPTAGSSYDFGSVPAAPTCEASDATSGVAGTCSVSGYATSVGTHTVTATATDAAGNVNTSTRTYTVRAWTTGGFYAPVDRGIHNTVKGGNTVPLKFELFAGATELTDVAVVSFTTQRVNCDGTLLQDGVEVTSNAGTSLRYDTSSGQFIQNWKTPTAVGTCQRAVMTALDGSTIHALFKIK